MRSAFHQRAPPLAVVPKCISSSMAQTNLGASYLMRERPPFGVTFMAELPAKDCRTHKGATK
jgi:hypothetical protein